MRNLIEEMDDLLEIFSKEARAARAAKAKLKPRGEAGVFSKKARGRRKKRRAARKGMSTAGRFADTVKRKRRKQGIKKRSIGDLTGKAGKIFKRAEKSSKGGRKAWKHFADAPWQDG